MVQKHEGTFLPIDLEIRQALSYHKNGMLTFLPFCQCSGGAMSFKKSLWLEHVCRGSPQEHLYQIILELEKWIQRR